MGFVMDGLDAEAYDRAYGDRRLLGRIGAYFHSRVWLMLFVATMIVVNAVAAIVLPLLLSRGIDNLSSSGITARAAAVLVGAIFGAGVVTWTTNFLRGWFTARLVGDVVLRLRQDAFEAVLKRDMSFYDEHPSGRIVSRVTADTEEFSTVVTLTLNLLSQGLLVILVGAVLVTINVRLAMITFVIMPLIVGVALAFRKIARVATQRAQRALARVTTNVQETMSGITVAKTFRQEATIYGEFKKVNEQSYQVNVRQGFIFNGIFPILLTIAGLGTTIVVYFGGTAVLAGDVSAGSWFFFVQAVGILWFPLISVASFWSQFQLGLSATERVFALIDAEP